MESSVRPWQNFLVQLSFHSLIACKKVCKKWLAIIANNSFFQAYILSQHSHPRHHSVSLLFRFSKVEVEVEAEQRVPNAKELQLLYLDACDTNTSLVNLNHANLCILNATFGSPTCIRASPALRHRYFVQMDPSIESHGEFCIRITHVFNLITDEEFTLQPCAEFEFFQCNVGFDTSSMTQKAVEIMAYYGHSEQCVALVYNLQTPTQHSLSIVSNKQIELPFKVWSCLNRSARVCADGALHWGPILRRHMFTLDLEDETF